MDEEAISDAFVRQHYAGLYALLQRRIADAAVAADLLNEALATAIAHTRAGRISQPERLGGYVYRVAMNLYRNYRRGFDNRRELRADGDTLQQIAGETRPLDEAPNQELAQQVRRIVASLPTARDREIVKRFYLDEDEKEDICRDLGLSALHFDKVIFRARQRMRGLLEAKGFRKSDFFGLLLVCFA